MSTKRRTKKPKSQRAGYKLVKKGNRYIYRQKKGSKAKTQRDNSRRAWIRKYGLRRYLRKRRRSRSNNTKKRNKLLREYKKLFGHEYRGDANIPGFKGKSRKRTKKSTKRRTKKSTKRRTKKRTTRRRRS